jgi:hypothetical protein
LLEDKLRKPHHKNGFFGICDKGRFVLISKIFNDEIKEVNEET